MNYDDLSVLFRKAINVLFVSNPRGTSLGVVLGVLLEGLMGVFLPAIQSLVFLNFDKLRMWHYISFGVLAMNMPSFLKRDKVSPSIVNYLRFIKEQEKMNNISPKRAEELYNELFAKLLEDVAFQPQEDLGENKQKFSESDK